MIKINKILCLGLIAVMIFGAFVSMMGYTVDAKTPDIKNAPMERYQITTWNYSNVMSTNIGGYTDDAVYSYIGEQGGINRITKWNNTKYYKSTGNNPCSLTNCSSYVYYVAHTGSVYRMSKSTFAINSYSISGAFTLNHVVCDGTYLWMYNDDPSTPSIKRTSLTGTGLQTYNLPRGGMNIINYDFAQDSTYIWYNQIDQNYMPYLNILGKMYKSNGTFIEYQFSSYADTWHHFSLNGDGKIYISYYADNVTYSVPFFTIFDIATGTNEYYFEDDLSGSRQYCDYVVRAGDYLYFSGQNDAYFPDIMEIYYHNLNDDTNGSFMLIHNSELNTKLFKDFNQGYLWYSNMNNSLMVFNFSKIGVMFDPSGSVQYPAGGEELYGGESSTINFTITNGSAPYKVWFNYTTDHISYYPCPDVSDPVSYDTAGAKSQSWTIPTGLNNETVSVAVNIFGEDMDYFVADSNDFIVSELPSVSFDTFPHMGQNMHMGDTYQINYTISNGLPNYTVFINYSVDLGSSWINIINQSHTYQGLKCFNWTIPDYDDHMICYLNIDVLDRNNRAASNTTDYFILAYPSGGGSPTNPDVVITHPTDAVTIGTTEYINWTVANGSGVYLVWINYSYVPIVTLNIVPHNETITFMICMGDGDYSYNWTVPDTPSEEASINISVIDGNSLRCYDQSGSFAIDYAPIEISITNPTGTPTWICGEDYDVNWTATGGQGDLTVSLFYFWDSIDYLPPIYNYIVIVENTSNDGNYVWTGPSNFGHRSNPIKIVAMAFDEGSNKDTDQTGYVFLDAPEITMILESPDGGENWTAGSEQEIYWTIDGGYAPFTVSLYYSIDNGTNWTEIDDNVTSDPADSYLWTVPNIDNQTYNQSFVCAIVYDDLLSTDSDQSDENFTIYYNPEIPPIIPPVIPPEGNPITFEMLEYPTSVSINTDMDFSVRVTCADGLKYVLLVYQFYEGGYSDSLSPVMHFVNLTLTAGDETNGIYSGTITGRDTAGDLLYQPIAKSNEDLQDAGEEGTVEITPIVHDYLGAFGTIYPYILIAGLIIGIIGAMYISKGSKTKTIGIILLIVGIAIVGYCAFVFIGWMGWTIPI